MRPLLVSCLFALVACDPVWKVENVATARPEATPTEQCIGDGLRATGLEVKDSDSVAKPAAGWNVRGHGSWMTVTWDPKKPEALTFLASGVGTQPPTGAVDGYRRMRDEVIAKLVPACGTWDVGPETCQRTPCAPVTPPPATTPPT